MNANKIVRGYITPDEFSELTSLCEREAVSISKVIRRGIREFIKQKKCEVILNTQTVERGKR